MCGIKPALRLIWLFNVALCSACRPGLPVSGPRVGKREPRASSGHDTNANNQADIVTPLYSVALYALSVILLTYGFSV